MRQQDKILSRQKTRLNPIKSFIAPVEGGGETKLQNIYDSITNRILHSYAREVATLYEQMLWILALLLLWLMCGQPSYHC